MRVRSNVNAQGYHSNHYVLKLPRNIEKLLFHCSASIASLVQISHSTVRPELSRPCPDQFSSDRTTNNIVEDVLSLTIKFYCLQRYKN